MIKKSQIANHPSKRGRRRLLKVANHPLVTDASGRKKTEIWIGLAQVRQKAGGPLGQHDQAFVTVLAPAPSREAFRRRVKTGLSDLALQLVRLERAKPLRIWLSSYNPDESLLELAEQAERIGAATFDTFHTFPG